MRRIYLFILVAMTVCLTGCGQIASTPAAQTKCILTGECLASTELTYYVPDSDGQQVRSNRFIFAFTMDFSNHVKERTDDKELALNWRDIPSEEIFDSFGPNKQAVRNEFERVYEDFSNNYISRFQKTWYEIATVLYNGGISLVANKDFAGVPAGENLAGLITCVPSDDNFKENPVISSGFNTPSNAGGFLGIPMEYISMTEAGIAFSIPMGEYKLVEEDVTFELQIPVKVVYYLNWLNDRLSNPNAPVPYKDEVLHCTFTTKHGLK